MKVDRARAVTKEFGGRTYYFCSDHCLHAFEAGPESYLREAALAAHDPAAMPSTDPNPERIPMTERAHELSTTADRQIAELIDMLSTLDQAALDRPCTGREKLGDGTIGAAVQHTADNYQRIAAFVQTSTRMSAAHRPAVHGGHRIPRFLRDLGHGPQDHAPRDHGADQHDNGYTATNLDLDAAIEQLNAARDTLGRIAELTNSQLDQVPPKNSFRFCDGQRTLEQVLAGLLKHQAHQVEALSAALA
jgi:YHS domain-containing protein